VLVTAANQAESEYTRAQISGHPGIYQLVAAELIEQAKRECRCGDCELYELVRVSCFCEDDCAERCRFLATQIIIQLLVLREHDNSLVARRRARLAMKLLGVEMGRPAREAEVIQ